jgi:hypothetical protein
MTRKNKKTSRRTTPRRVPPGGVRGRYKYSSRKRATAKPPIRENRHALRTLRNRRRSVKESPKSTLLEYLQRSILVNKLPTCKKVRERQRRAYFAYKATGRGAKKVRTTNRFDRKLCK